LKLVSEDEEADIADAEDEDEKSEVERLGSIIEENGARGGGQED
jgi:hypothetical protein